MNDARVIDWKGIEHALVEADRLVSLVATIVGESGLATTPRTESLERSLFEARVELLRARDDAKRASVEVVRVPTTDEQYRLDMLEVRLAALESRPRGEDRNGR